MPPRAIRAQCSAFRYCPDPLGIVPAEQFDKLEFVITLVLVHSIYYQLNIRFNCHLQLGNWQIFF